MTFTKEYLLDLVAGKVAGDFFPFNTGSWSKTEKYIKGLVGRIEDIHTIKVKADFNHYGSGTASYVHLYISKKDQSGTKTIVKGNLQTEETEGLMIYLCRLAPYAVYSIGFWSTTYENKKYKSASSHFIEAEAIGTLPEGNWQDEIQQIKDILNEYGYVFLTREELDVVLDFQIFIPTVLANPPYKVFDCLFYWSD